MVGPGAVVWTRLVYADPLEFDYSIYVTKIYRFRELLSPVFDRDQPGIMLAATYCTFTGMR